MLPQDLTRRINPQGRVPIEIQKTLNFLFLPQRIPISIFLPGLYTSFINCRNQPELRLNWSHLRWPVIHPLDTVIPSCDFSFLLPVAHLALHCAKISDRIHELRVIQFPLVESVGDIIPELDNIAGRHRPKLERLITADFPSGTESDHIVVVDFTLDHVTAVTLFHLAYKVSLLIIDLSIKLVFNQVDHRGVIELVWRLRQILSPVHPLEHRRIHRCPSDLLFFFSAVTEPPVALQSQGSAMNSILILNSSLNKQVVSEDLGDSTILLRLFTSFPDLLGKPI